MLITSGGTRWKRKRDKAARLHPVVEDAASTTQLFNGNGRTRRTRPDVGPSILPSDRPPAPSTSTPLLRYEWRAASGETVVVEAGWPTSDGPPEGVRTVTAEPPLSGAIVDSSRMVDQPRLDLRT